MYKPLRIYCDGKNKRFAQIAVNAGFLYGVRIPAAAIIDQPIIFTDVDWKNPNEAQYLAHVKQIRPKLATVIDIETIDTLAQALDWANQLIDYVEHIIFIPKIDIIDRLPPQINNKEVILGYSVPSSYGKTDIPIHRFLSHRIHVLGGSPHVQMRLYKQHPNMIYSVDGNYFTKMANRMQRYWVPGDNDEITNRFWKRNKAHAPEQIFQQSCKNILAAWERVFTGDSIWLADRRHKA